MRMRLALFVALALAALTGASARAQAPATVTVEAQWTGAAQKSFEAVLAGFERAHPGVRVQYVSAGGQLATLLTSALRAGKPPDVAVLPGPTLLHGLARAHALKPITFAARTIAASYAPVWRQLGTIDGKLDALYFRASNESTVWYDGAVFRKAGLQPPATWDGLAAAAAALAKAGVRPFSIAGADSWTLTDLFENVYLRQAGPARYDALTRHAIRWTDPSVKRALRTMTALLAGAKGALQTDLATSVAQVFSSSPRAAMLLEGDYALGIARASDSAGDANVGVFPFPSIGGSPLSVVGDADAVVMLRNTRAARALVSYLATPQAAAIWARRGDFSSPNRRVPAAAYRDPLVRSTATALATATVFRFDMSELQPPAFGATLGQGELKLFVDLVRRPGRVNAVAAQLEAAAAQAYAPR